MNEAIELLDDQQRETVFRYLELKKLLRGQDSEARRQQIRTWYWKSGPPHPLCLKDTEQVQILRAIALPDLDTCLDLCMSGQDKDQACLVLARFAEEEMRACEQVEAVPPEERSGFQPGRSYGETRAVLALVACTLLKHDQELALNNIYLRASPEWRRAMTSLVRAKVVILTSMAELARS